MQAVKQIATFFLVLAAVLGLALGLWLTAGDPNGWRTWLFRAGHQMVHVTDEEYGSREVAFVLRPGEDTARAVKACAKSFELMLLQEGSFVHCVAYGSAADAQLSQRKPQLVCERGRAIQMPYASAETAEIVLNQGEHCAVQPRYLPEYVRSYI